MRWYGLVLIVILVFGIVASTYAATVTIPDTENIFAFLKELYMARLQQVWGIIAWCLLQAWHWLVSLPVDTWLESQIATSTPWH